MKGNVWKNGKRMYVCKERKAKKEKGEEGTEDIVAEWLRRWT